MSSGFHRFRVRLNFVLCSKTNRKSKKSKIYLPQNSEVSNFSSRNFRFLLQFKNSIWTIANDFDEKRKKKFFLPSNICKKKSLKKSPSPAKFRRKNGHGLTWNCYPNFLWLLALSFAYTLSDMSEKARGRNSSMSDEFLPFFLSVTSLRIIYCINFQWTNTFFTYRSWKKLKKFFLEGHGKMIWDSKRDAKEFLQCLKC